MSKFAKVLHGETLVIGIKKCYILKKTKDCIGLLLGVFERGPIPNIWYFRVMADPIKGNKITSSYNDIINLLGHYSLNNLVML